MLVDTSNIVVTLSFTTWIILYKKRLYFKVLLVLLKACNTYHIQRLKVWWGVLVCSVILKIRLLVLGQSTFFGLHLLTRFPCLGHVEICFWLKPCIEKITTIICSQLNQALYIQRYCESIVNQQVYTQEVN